MNRRLAVGTLLALVFAGVGAWFLVEDQAPRVGITTPATSDLPSNIDGPRVLASVSAQPLANTTVAVADARDWVRSYHESIDDFALAKDLVGAALLGSARAQHLLGQVLLRCEVHKIVLAPYKEGTVADRVELHLAKQPTSLDRGSARFRREALRCERLFSEDPFSGYDLPEEAKNFRYWSNRAIESGDPLAVMSRAVRSVAERPDVRDAEKDRAFREALLRDVRTAILSRDTAALFAVGGVFSYPSVVTDPEQGYAWQVAACEAGYDCSNSNPDWGFSCVEEGRCEGALTIPDMLQRDLGATKYAEIYANAQDIQYKINTNDWDGLQKYLEIK